MDRTWKQSSSYNRIAKAFPIIDRGIDYGSTPSAGAVMMNDLFLGHPPN